MPAWWNSLETVSSLTWYLRWIGACLTIFGGLCVVATLATSKRAETLREKRDADRHLSPEQRQSLIKKIGELPDKEKCALVSVVGDDEGFRFGIELEVALREAGVNCAGVEPALFSTPPRGGVFVATSNMAIRFLLTL